jgi:hypothetical protein
MQVTIKHPENKRSVSWVMLDDHVVGHIHADRDFSSIVFIVTNMTDEQKSEVESEVARMLGRDKVGSQSIPKLPKELEEQGNDFYEPDESDFAGEGED